MALSANTSRGARMSVRRVTVKCPHVTLRRLNVGSVPDSPAAGRQHEIKNYLHEAGNGGARRNTQICHTPCVHGRKWQRRQWRKPWLQFVRCSVNDGAELPNVMSQTCEAHWRRKRAVGARARCTA